MYKSLSQRKDLIRLFESVRVQVVGRRQYRDEGLVRLFMSMPAKG